MGSTDWPHLLWESRHAILTLAARWQPAPSSHALSPRLGQEDVPREGSRLSSAHPLQPAVSWWNLLSPPTHQLQSSQSPHGPQGPEGRPRMRNYTYCLCGVALCQAWRTGDTLCKDARYIIQYLGYTYATNYSSLI